MKYVSKLQKTLLYWAMMNYTHLKHSVFISSILQKSASIKRSFLNWHLKVGSWDLLYNENVNNLSFQATMISIGRKD